MLRGPSLSWMQQRDCTRRTPMFKSLEVHLDDWFMSLCVHAMWKTAEVSLWSRTQRQVESALPSALVCLKSVVLSWSNRDGYWMSTACQVWHLNERVVGICLCARPGLDTQCIMYRAARSEVYISAQTDEHRLLECMWDRRPSSCRCSPALFQRHTKPSPSPRWALGENTFRRCWALLFPSVSTKQLMLGRYCRFLHNLHRSVHTVLYLLSEKHWWNQQENLHNLRARSDQ